jgi:hypothetical protein
MATAKGSKGKKDAKPEIVDPTLKAAIDEWIERKIEFDTAEALLGAVKEQIVSAVRPQWLQACAGRGKTEPSATVTGDGQRKITFTQTSRYSNTPEARMDALRERFGPIADDYFKMTLTISLKKDSANAEEALQYLVERVSPEWFMLNFDVKKEFVVQPRFHTDYTTRPEITQIAEPFIQEETIRPYSPSLKVQ